MTDHAAARAALLEAWPTIRPDLGDLVARLEAVLPAAPTTTFAPEEIEQLLNAFEALVLEGLRAEGTETRDFLLETAVPAIVAGGQPPLDLLRSHIGVFVLLTERLCGAVPSEHAQDAALWLAGFFAGYGSDSTERALAVGG